MVYFLMAFLSLVESSFVVFIIPSEGYLCNSLTGFRPHGVGSSSFFLCASSICLSLFSLAFATAINFLLQVAHYILHFSVVYSVCKACEDKVIDYGRAGYADLEETVMVL